MSTGAGPKRNQLKIHEFSEQHKNTRKSICPVWLVVIVVLHLLIFISTLHLRKRNAICIWVMTAGLTCGGHILQRAILRQLPPFQEPCSHFWCPVQEPLVDCLTSTQPTIKRWLQVARHSSSLCSHPSFNLWTGAPAEVTFQCHSTYVAAPHLSMCTIYTVY